MTDSQLLRVPWPSLDIDQRRKSIAVAQRKGAALADFLWSDERLRKSGEFPGLTFDLYEEQALGRLAGDEEFYWRRFRFHPPEDLRPAFYLDAYARQLARIQGREAPSFSMDHWSSQLHNLSARFTLLNDTVLALKEDRDESKRRKRPKDVRDANETLERAQGFLRRVRVERDTARIHHTALEYAPVWLGQPLEACFTRQTKANLEEAVARTLINLGQAIRCEVDEGLCDAAARCLEAGVSPNDSRLREFLLPYTDALTGDERLNELLDCLQFDPVLDWTINVPSVEEEFDYQEDDGRPFYPNRLCKEMREKYERVLCHFRNKRVAVLGMGKKGRTPGHWKYVFECAEIIAHYTEERSERSFAQELGKLDRAEIAISISRWQRRRTRRAYDRLSELGVPVIVVVRGNSTTAVIDACYEHFYGRQEKREEKELALQNA